MYRKWKDGWMNERMDRWVDRWMYGLGYVPVYSICFKTFFLFKYHQSFQQIYYHMQQESFVVPELQLVKLLIIKQATDNCICKEILTTYLFIYLFGLIRTYFPPFGTFFFFSQCILLRYSWVSKNWLFWSLLRVLVVQVWSF